MNNVLVLGATGKTGGRVAARLRERGVPVRLGSRSSSTPFDWNDRTTWKPLLQDVEAVYVSYHPDLAVPGAPEAVGEFAELAMAAGVQRLVLLSGRGEEEAQAAEQRLQDAGAAWTVVRASWFAQNFSEGYLLEPVQSGELVLPVGDVPEPFIDVDDIADVAVAALTEDGHAGQVYEVTGPRLLTFADAAKEISAATGREVTFIQVPIDAYAQALRAENLPEDVIEFLTYLFTTVLDGRNAQVTDGVQRALGRPARDFSDYARAAAATGQWKRAT